MNWQQPFRIQKRRSFHGCSLTSDIGNSEMLLEIQLDIRQIDWRNFDAVSVQGVDHVTAIFHLTTTDDNQLHVCNVGHKLTIHVTVNRTLQPRRTITHIYAGRLVPYATTSAGAAADPGLGNQLTGDLAMSPVVGCHT